MSDPTITDLRRELEKAREVLASAETYLARHAEMNAALHCAERVMYSPLNAKVVAAIAGINHALERTEQPVTDALAGRSLADTAGLVRVLADLDRCTHGRHEGDGCNGCGGPSKGNPHLRTGTVIGYGLHGELIVMPDRDHKHDPKAWRARTDGEAQR